MKQMNLKKVLAAALIAASLPAVTFANGHLWYDRNAHIGQLGKNEKLYIYPIIDLDGSYWVNHQDVKSNAFKANEYLATRFVRRLKFKNVNSMGAQIDEKKEIRTDDYDKFLKSKSGRRPFKPTTLFLGRGKFAPNPICHPRLR